jgi:hypothetical protein
MKKKQTKASSAEPNISPGEALGNYWLRVAIMKFALCSMNTVNAALHGIPTKQRALRLRVLDACGRFGVDVSELRRKLELPR